MAAMAAARFAGGGLHRQHAGAIAAGAQVLAAVAEQVVEETAHATAAEARAGNGETRRCAGDEQEAAFDHGVAAAAGSRVYW